MLENPCELYKVELARLDWSFFVQIVHFFVAEPIAQSSQEFAQIIFIQRADIGLVETRECVSYDIFRVRPLKPLPKKSQKHCKVDGSRSLVHHVVQVLVTYILSQGGQHVLEVFVVNESVPVLVDHIEGLFELLNLVLVEHGEHVRGRPLGPLLRPGPTGRFATRHGVRVEKAEKACATRASPTSNTPFAPGGRRDGTESSTRR